MYPVANSIFTRFNTLHGGNQLYNKANGDADGCTRIVTFSFQISINYVFYILHILKIRN